MNALASHDGAQRRRSNFFRDTPRDPEASTTHEALEAQALALVRASLEADALDNRRDLRPADMDRMLSAAKGKLRGMSERELRGISASSAVLKTLTDYSLSAAPVADPRLQAALALDVGRDNPAGADGSNGLTARLLRADLERAERIASSARYDGMGGERLSQSDLQNMASARAAALSYGMPWALDNPELLKLGAGAIKTLHEAGVRRETFERMTSDRVGIRAETAVNFAGWAKRHALTPEQTNRLMDSTSDLHENLTRALSLDERRKAQQDLDRALDKFVKGPNTPEARRALEEERMRHARTEQQREQVRANTRELEQVVQQTQAKAVKAETTEKLEDDLYAQAAAAPDAKPQATKKAEAGTVAPVDGGSTKTAVVATKPAAPKV